MQCITMCTPYIPFYVASGWPLILDINYMLFGKFLMTWHSCNVRIIKLNILNLSVYDATCNLLYFDYSLICY
jgi:hypothetical protein